MWFENVRSNIYDVKGDDDVNKAKYNDEKNLLYDRNLLYNLVELGRI